MEGFGSLGFSNVSIAAKKKRSNTSRRPRNDSQLHSEFQDFSSLSSTPPSDNNCINTEDGPYGESDEASNNGSFRGGNEWKHGGTDSKRCSEGLLAPTNWKSTSSEVSFGGVSDGLDNEKKVKKVKLKVGGVTRTIDTKSVSVSGVPSAAGYSSRKSSRLSDAPQEPRKFIIQDNMDNRHSVISEKGSGLRGVRSKGLSKGSLTAGAVDHSIVRISDENMSMRQTEKYEPIRKSKRVPKRRLLGVLDDEDDDEIRFLEKVKMARATEDYEDDEGERKQRKISKVLERDVDCLYDVDLGNYGSSGLGKEGKKSRSGKASEDTDYVEDEESVSDVELEHIRKRATKETIDFVGDSKEARVTTRQRALQANKDVSSNGVSQIEFPNGLPPAPSKKQKEKLSEVEQQLKKTEAAQRRRMQVEKAARESEAEAIRKILGQESSRKKREERIKKRQEELAQEKAANAMMLASDSVRWVNGPSGTIVTFPDEMGLPSIFDNKPRSYPPPREKCAVPSCTNPYKYRDSKSKLPLCSLQCYKAIHEKLSPELPVT